MSAGARYASRVARVLAAATVDEVTAALYLSWDYEIGALHRWALETVESWAVVELDTLTPAAMAAALACTADPDGLADCRATAREILAAQ